MSSTPIRYFVKIDKAVEKKPERPSENATHEELIEWDKKMAVWHDRHETLMKKPEQLSFYLTRDGELRDRVIRGQDFWTTEDIAQVLPKALLQLPPLPEGFVWDHEAIPFKEEEPIED